MHLSGLLFQACGLQHAPACSNIQLSKFSLANTADRNLYFIMNIGLNSDLVGTRALSKGM